MSTTKANPFDHPYKIGQTPRAKVAQRTPGLPHSVRMAAKGFETQDAKRIKQLERQRDDLLAALRGALEFMLANCHGEPKAGTYAGDRIIASRAAIAKATNE